MIALSEETGRPCIVCARLISPDQVENAIVVRTAGMAVTLWAHLPCFQNLSRMRFQRIAGGEVWRGQFLCLRRYSNALQVDRVRGTDGRMSLGLFGQILRRIERLAWYPT